MKLLLASRSATRRRMLHEAGIAFESVDSSFDEDDVKAALRAEGLDARGLADALAERKALGVAAGSGNLVLGSDQTLERADGSMLDKPGSPAELAEQLRSLSGRSHFLHSAAVIVEAGAPVWRHTQSVELRVRDLTDAFLGSYIEQEYDAVRHHVGGYRIEGPGVQLFDSILGDHFAILGLPLLPLLGYLRERGLLTS